MVREMVRALTDGQTDGRTATQNFRGYNIIPRHFFGGEHKKLRLRRTSAGISLVFPLLLSMTSLSLV